jgi:putative membrane protein
MIVILSFQDICTIFVRNHSSSAMLLNKRVPVTYILNKVKFDIINVLFVSIVVLVITETYNELLPEMQLTIPAFIGTAISILLSFKLNQSYDRWWEARKIWGSIVNDSRSLVIQLHALVEGGNDLTKQIAYRQIAWCYSLGQSLRGLNAMENVEAYLTDADLSAISSHKNKPLAMLYLHGMDIKELKNRGCIDAFSQIQLDNTIVRLCDAQGRSERIKGTVFPVTYRLFLHSIIYLFVVTLSISLRDMPVHFEVPLLVLISSAFFLLEKSATHMQDPFENRPTDTAMTGIARTIEINIKQLLNEKDIPDPLPAMKFYLL